MRLPPQELSRNGESVFNVLRCNEVAVDGLLERPAVKALSFVGSTPVAQAPASLPVYMRRKSIPRRWPESTEKGAEFVMPVPK